MALRVGEFGWHAKGGGFGSRYGEVLDSVGIARHGDSWLRPLVVGGAWCLVLSCLGVEKFLSLEGVPCSGSWLICGIVILGCCAKPGEVVAEFEVVCGVEVVL